MISDIRLEQVYLLYVNQRQVPIIFTTLEKAQEAAKPHIPSEAALQIKSTWGRSAIGILDTISSGSN
jgi:hypothetical protein